MNKKTHSNRSGKAPKNNLSVLWSARDALVLKGVSLVLACRLVNAFPRRCFHYPAGRGVKAALGELARALSAHRFVVRTDVRSYYDSIQPVKVMDQLVDLIGHDPILYLVWQYMDRVVEKDGHVFSVRQGISRGCSLSPLIGALFLNSLDERFENRDLFYLRYMDDILVLAPTRWKLRSAVKAVRQALSALDLTIHPDKTFVGRIERGFSWLGCWVTSEGLVPLKKSI